MRRIPHIAGAQPALSDGPFDIVFIDATMIGPPPRNSPGKRLARCSKRN
jgi:hypothetical protein